MLRSSCVPSHEEKLEEWNDLPATISAIKQLLTGLTTAFTKSFDSLEQTRSDVRLLTRDMERLLPQVHDLSVKIDSMANSKADKVELARVEGKVDTRLEIAQRFEGRIAALEWGRENDLKSRDQQFNVKLAVVGALGALGGGLAGAIVAHFMR
jgi:chromosome segregation ATPase